jgi:peptide-methionine (S)-S-oxide reductase
MKNLTQFLIILFFAMTIQVNAKEINSENFGKKNIQKNNYETAILSGGCFWGMEELLRNFNGVLETNVGYIGDDIENPTYELILSKLTKFVEAVEVKFDPNKTSYEKILKFFFTIHDPTTLDKQGNDVGYSYSSNIFYLNKKQSDIAKKVIIEGDSSGVFPGKIVTRVLEAKKFWPAEKYHQDYLQKNLFGYTCHHPRKEWEF